MFAGFAIIGSAPAGAVTTFAVGNDHASCNTLSGTLKFATALHNSGPTTGPNTITATLALAGCFDDDKSAVKMFKGAGKATIQYNGANCAGLLGPSNSSGSSDLVWTPAAGQAFTPKITVGTLQKQATHVTFTQISGGTFSVPVADNPWNSSYGLFSIGAQYGTAPLSATGEFTGGDGGATSWFAATTREDLGNILTTCGTGTAAAVAGPVPNATGGLTTLNIGIGGVHSR